jgi:hypothetical protein
MEGPSLQNLVGQQVTALIPALHPSTLTQVTIHAVETGGIWIEHNPVTHKILRDAKQAASAKTVMLFVPYSGIDWILALLSRP